ncbi:beta-1,4-galactosyltransferase 1 isoform X2 [Xenopus laevis]|uniref:Beta-1,4-galactosyltransferase n=1 Tax=Xenopus laevis TaxID=8355 RepID=A0A8J0UWW7_XENLA|nr:beta-1,4-galactosyltransferase 1 isoform X2 [Xenopus laevis]
MLSSIKTMFLILAVTFLLGFTFFYMKSPVFQEIYLDKLNYKMQHKMEFKNESWRLMNKFPQLSSDQDKNLPECPEIPPDLGPLDIRVVYNTSLPMIISQNPNIRPGGRSRPQHCMAQQKVAIIIPFRNREAHLKTWLYYMHPFLQRQQADYGVYVVEQMEDTVFNRAKLMNVGYATASKDYDYSCFIFSDVDIIPMDGRNLYRCSTNPRHMANSVDKFNFKLPYNDIFGGVVAFKKEHFIKVNGFSNVFWGWGGEDDELFQRVVAVGLKVDRPDQTIARSRMISHKRDPGNERNGKSFPLIRKAYKRLHQDGLSSLNYTIISITSHKLYTKVTVDIGDGEDASLEAN